ncbi:phosphoadenylyl-sulfate reductase [soil metagenome]
MVTLLAPRIQIPSPLAPQLDDLDVAAAATELEGAPATDILRWAWLTIPRFCVTSSFGVDSVVLLSLVAQVSPDIPVLFLDTGYHFNESLEYRQDLQQRLGLQAVVDVTPELSVPQQDSRYGSELYRRDPDNCCEMRKVAPLDQALRDYDGWASGLRRAQTNQRADTPVVSAVTEGGRRLLKVSPLAAWTTADMAGHRRLHSLPIHPLAQQGFGSIGCAPCTRPTSPEEDARAGRWAGLSKTECGIHLPLTE